MAAVANGGGFAIQIAGSPAVTELVGPSQQRKTLIISTDGTGNVHVGIHEQMISNFQFGLVLTTSAPFVVIDRAHWGSLVGKAWAARSDGGAVNMGIFEVMEG